MEGLHPNDVIVEKIFDIPVLHISSGRLISGNQALQLAVLHPTLLSVYSLVIKSGKTDHGSQSYLNLLYEHRLRKSAANFVVGPFGGSQNRDFICVQSLDGLLSFFEQESQVTHVALPDFLLPGPISYAFKSDCVITTSSDWGIVAYKYKMLSEAADESTDHIYSKPEMIPEWKYNLGESIIDLFVINDAINKDTWIMVLGERNLFCLTENGRTKFMKRLDYCPICFQVYVLEGHVYSLIVADSNMLLIYHNTTLKWSAHLDYLPVAIHRAFLKNIKGAIVLLTEEGRLECCYLGTEPSFFVAPPINVQEIDYENAEHELLALEKVLRNSSDVTVQNNIEKELQLNIVVDTTVEVCTFEHNIKNAASNYMCRINIDVIPQILFQEVQISVLVQRPLKVVPNSCFYSNLHEKSSLTCHAFLDEALDVPTLLVEVKASIISNLGVPRTLSRISTLPITLVLEGCAVEKENRHKITVSTNQPPVGISTLFSEYASISSPNAIAFKGASENTVTILLAKSSERYRLQSDSFTTLSLAVEQLILRLRNYYSNKSDYKISFSGALPANEVLEYVNAHFKVKKGVNELQASLSQLSGQFRLIQKRLIAKYKAKNPTSLKSLELLLNDTDADILETTEKLEIEMENLSKSQTDLACAVHLVKQLVGLLDIDNELLSVINSAFCTMVYELDSQSWEDVTDASLCYLLRTSLAKTEKDKLRAPHTSFDEVEDLTKLEKHWSQVLERLPKQHKLKETSDLFDEENDRDGTVETNDELKIEKPVGSQYGEFSTRLLSARKSLRKRHKMDDSSENEVGTYVTN